MMLYSIISVGKQYLELFNCAPETLVLHSDAFNHLTINCVWILLCKQISSDSFKNKITYKLLILQVICIIIQPCANKLTLVRLKMLSTNYAFTIHI